MGEDTGQRIIVLLEGRDAAGKGGAIERFSEHHSPRGARATALQKPNDRERGRWYFQRHIEHLPTTGEIVFCNAIGTTGRIERMMGFCSPAQSLEFLGEALNSNACRCMAAYASTSSSSRSAARNHCGASSRGAAIR